MKVTRICGVYLTKVKKIANNVFESIDLYRKGYVFLGHALYKGKKKFQNRGFMGIKRQRI
jgi:hypothetical protein